MSARQYKLAFLFKQPLSFSAYTTYKKIAFEVKQVLNLNSYFHLFPEYLATLLYTK